MGSLYQYVPNKEAILFRQQTDDWKRTGALLEGILADANRPPLQRVREVVLAFFRSEWEEAALRLALGDAAPAYRDAPEVAEHRNAGKRLTTKFMVQLLPTASVNRRRFAGELLMTVMSSALAVGDMLCAYLEREMAEVT